MSHFDYAAPIFKRNSPEEQFAYLLQQYQNGEKSQEALKALAAKVKELFS